MKNVRKKQKTFSSSHLSGVEPQLPVGAGSPRLFTYHEIWPSAIINDLTIYCLIKNKKAPQISLRGSLG